MQALMQPYVFATLLVGALLLVAALLKPFFAPLVLAAVFAAALHPVYTQLVRLLKGYESVASLCTVLLALIIVIVVIGGIATQLFFEARTLYGSLSGARGNAPLVIALPEEIRTLVHSFAPSLSTSFDLAPYFRSGLSWLIGNMGAVFSGLTRTVLDLFIFLTALYYLLRDGGRVAARFVSVSPLYDQDDRAILERLHLAVNSVLRGSLAVALVQGTLTGVGFLLFGVPNPALWGSVAAIAALVPGLGTALITGPAILYLALSGESVAALGLLAWGAGAVGMVDNILGPRLMGAVTRIHPLLMLLSVLGGLSFFGPIGFLVGPLTVSLFLALLDIYAQKSAAASVA